jgi:hypothetical protein
MLLRFSADDCSNKLFSTEKTKELQRKLLVTTPNLVSE